MKVRRELSDLVAEKDYGAINLLIAEHITGFDIGYTQCPDYATRIADAWLVVEKFDLWTIEWDFSYYQCVIMKDGGHYSEQADTAPLAICLAALKAVDKINLVK